MKKYLVIGKPIDHSLSPDLHNYWIKKYKIDALYEKKKITEVTKADAMASLGEKKSKKTQKKEKRDVANIAYYKIPVDFEITGNFLGYIKFKRQLSLSQKTLNFDNESIKVVQGRDSTGAIIVNGTLTIVGLADEFF